MLYTKNIISQFTNVFMRMRYMHINGKSADKFRHPRSDAYLAEQVLLNKQQISGGGSYLHCYRNCHMGFFKDR